MIESLTLQDAATFRDTPTVLADLKPVNYFYGTNGSGKTTISRVIADTNGDYPSCQLKWAGDHPLSTEVYNRDFITRHFDAATGLSGVFTVGEENIELQADINNKREQIDALSIERNRLNDALNHETTGAKAELESLRNSFDNDCWPQKVKHDGMFQEAFRGCRNDRKRFSARLIEEATTNTSDLCDYGTLKTQAATVFGDTQERRPIIPEIDTSPLQAVENHELLGKTIVGSADVDVAALIDKARIADWVKQGTNHLHECKPKCPFCQQTIPDDLESRLAAYFDSSYQTDCDAIERARKQYATASQALQDTIQGLIDTPQDGLDTDVLQPHKTTFDALIAKNLLKWESKSDAPGTKVTLDPTADVLASITELIDGYNVSAKAHNETLDNIEAEKKTLTGQVWRYLLDVELKAQVPAFLTKQTMMVKQIEDLGKDIASNNDLLCTANRELEEMEQRTTGVVDTMNKINGYLKDFGFTTFKLRQAPDNPHSYELVRDNGQPAADTLSDGEKTFLTFLYFYHLVEGSLETTGTTDKRVVVVDDPVSSVDSDVMFVVSTMLKQLMTVACEGTGPVAQLIILTHNVYFHKEVTYRPYGIKKAHQSYWLVSRQESHSTAVRCPENPIKSSYEMLWEEVRDPKRSPRTICNTLRRILEYYFGLLDNKDFRNLGNGLTPEEKLTCRSFVSWMHDGSHAGIEDQHLSIGEDLTAKYLVVFKRIFIEQGHQAHYNMMMKLDAESD